MRRFIAYLSLAFAGLVLIGTTFTSTFTKTYSNLDFANGRELVFRVSNLDESELDNTDGVNKIASIMEERMENYGSTKYEIVTEGEDTIKVKVSEHLSEQYEQIKTYLTFDGAFALGTKTDTMATGEEFLLEGKESYVTFSGVYPTIVIPVDTENDQFKAVIAEANKLAEDTQNQENATGEQDAETTSTYIYLAHNFDVEEDLISELLSDSENYDEDKADKLLMQFDIASLWFNDEEKEIATMINIDTDGDGSYSPLDVSKGNELASYYVNLLNSEALPYEVEFIYEDSIAPIQENLIALDSHRTVAFSNTFIATLFAIVIISLLLAVFYRYAAIAIGTLSIASTYLALVFSILFSVEFNFASVIGLIGVAVASLVSGVIYLTKVKEECYHGRTLKKANLEGAKKALFPIVDINVLLIIVGAIVYWLGGKMMISLAASFVFGGIVSLILNTLVMRLLMWLLTNTTSFTGKYSIIGVEEDKVPNLMKEEKQTYFGPFQDKDFTSKRKPLGIVMTVLAVASIAGAVTFGVIGNGQMFNAGNYKTDNTYLYVETSTNDSVFDQAYVENILANTYTVKDNESTKIEILSVKTYTLDKVEEEVTTTYTYIVATLPARYTGNENAVIKDGDSIVAEATLNEIFEEVVEESSLDINATSSFKVGTKVNKQQPNSSWILIACSVAIGFAFVYYLLRYGISKSLAALITSVTASVITIGFFALTRIVAFNDILIALPLVLFTALALSVIHSDKEKDITKEDYTRTKDSTSDHRRELMLKANSLSAGPVLTTLILVLFIGVNFFGIGSAEASMTFIFIILGSLLAGLLVTTLSGPLSAFFYKLIKRINMPKLNIKRKRKKVKKVKSGEPEEAIFIGMND